VPPRSRRCSSEELYGLGRGTSLRWLTVGTALYAVGAPTIDVIAGNPLRVSDPPMALLVLVGMVVALGARAGYRPPRFHEWRVVAQGRQLAAVEQESGRVGPWCSGRADRLDGQGGVHGGPS